MACSEKAAEGFVLAAFSFLESGTDPDRGLT
jgi:hypothetical protein